MEETQLLKGILEGCVLKLISEKETYGYELISQLNEYGFAGIQEGTLYLVLNRLEKRQYITCRIGRSPLGPRRKYFSITEYGREYLIEFEKSYDKITSQANRIFRRGNDVIS
ncbi:PadR family transcriptional regulator [Candidatus Stoquefichus massiliensis]|uniref:PadR family transcriptional regulator n=1 Tax=Candidatus Stoquefichus massiliensis TaxID=1470350 RepID=UPI0004801A53|nr:PadR family transcriptional regulator [Candidatus Stoquefichus massiliensis]